MPKGQKRIKGYATSLTIVRAEILDFIRRHNMCGSAREFLDFDNSLALMGQVGLPHFRAYYDLGETPIMDDSPRGKFSQWRRYQSNLFNSLDYLAKQGVLIKIGSGKGNHNVRFTAAQATYAP